MVDMADTIKTRKILWPQNLRLLDFKGLIERRVGDKDGMTLAELYGCLYVLRQFQNEFAEGSS